MNAETNIRLKQHAEAFDKAAAELKTEHAAQLTQLSPEAFPTGVHPASRAELLRRMEDHLRTQIWTRGAHPLLVRVLPSASDTRAVTIQLTLPDRSRSVDLTSTECDTLLSILYDRVTCSDVIDLAQAVIG